MNIHDLLAQTFAPTWQRVANKAAHVDSSPDLFSPYEVKVPFFQITVDPTNLNLLGQNPRNGVKSQIKIGNETFTDVSLHLKGAAGSFRGWDDKPGLTLNFDKFTKDQDFYSLKKLHLNNGVQDGSFFHELLGNELALAMGVPACRCTHAVVQLNGRRPELYVLKEGFDKAWLRRNFGNSDGNLYDGGFCTDVDGELKVDVGKDVQRQDLKALAGASRVENPEHRFMLMERMVDLERFCAAAALQILTTDWDGYVRKPNNYRLYVPTGGKAVFIPHGMDQLWGNPEEALWPGWGGLVARAILDHPVGKKLTVSKLSEASQRHFTSSKLNFRIDGLLPRTKAALIAADRKDQADGLDGAVKDLKDRLSKRMSYVRHELPQLR